MKTRLIALFSIMLLLSVFMMLSLPLPVSAHPGRTDGNGGHTDRNTSEYHYHHGYPAHDHWDMDSDGEVDCPYNFDEQTNRNSGNTGGIDYNTDSHPHSNPQDDTTQKNKGSGSIFSHIAIGSVVAFFVLVNCLAIYIDKTDYSPEDAPTSLLSVFISIISSIIVFALLFYIIYTFKQPIAFRVISFTEMIQILFFSAIFGSIVWFVTSWVTAIINTFLCTLFKVEVYGWFGHFERLTIPLSYAFTVFLFILQ